MLRRTPKRPLVAAMRRAPPARSNGGVSDDPVGLRVRDEPRAPRFSDSRSRGRGGVLNRPRPRAPAGGTARTVTELLYLLDGIVSLCDRAGGISLPEAAITALLLAAGALFTSRRLARRPAVSRKAEEKVPAV
ncbi:hypothetical protein GCM10010191_18490 [Actinomadura vinacea]|uniref:LPXTG cell wall anchor domain-containing protein n=1 Tax=Actinomadura vinacea TaxID=115336 RepID=A0ABN3IR06_9ACTN